MAPIPETKTSPALRWCALGLVLLAACGAEVPRSAQPRLDELVDPPDTRPRTFVVSGDVVDVETLDALVPVPRAIVSFAWVDRGRLECAQTWCDDVGRFELFTKPGQYVPPDTRGTLFATTRERLAFASLVEVPIGGVERIRLTGQSGMTGTSTVSVRDGEGNLLEHGTLEPRLLLPRPPSWGSSLAKSNLRGSPVQFAAPSLRFELVVRASGFVPATLGPFEPGCLPASLVVDLERVPAQPRSVPEAVPAEPVAVGDVVGTLIPPRGVPVEELELQVTGFGYRGIALDGSFLLPDLPAGTHVVHVSENVRGTLEPAHVSGREWDTSIVCYFGPVASRFGLRAQGFLVDVDTRAVVHREVDLSRLPAHRIEGRITLDGEPPAALEDAPPSLAQLRHPISGAIICEVLVGADGRFVIGLDEPREVQLVVQNPGLHFAWRAQQALILQREPITWTRQLVTGTLELEPAWLEGELRPPAEFVVWQGDGGLEVTVLAWEEDPVTRKRRFDCVPAGPVILHGRRLAGGARIPVGNGCVEPLGVTTLRLDR